MGADPLGPRINLQACREYALSRQTSEGGFCFYAYREWGVEEPNTPDTYAAIATLRLLAQAIPEEDACRAWLQRQQDPSGGYPMLGIGYAALMALHLLGAQPLHDPRPYLLNMARLLRLTGHVDVDLAGRVRDALRCIKLWQAYQLIITPELRARLAAALDHLQGDDGGYGMPGASLPETARAVALCTALVLPVGQSVLDYVQRCEGPPYGFHITPTSISSSLESHHGGMRVLHHFGVSPRQPELVRGYVASCQTSVGGFGRASGAIARLDDTLRALEILSMLGVNTSE